MMKNFYKIVAAFSIIFTIGFFATYFSINYTFEKIRKKQLVNDIPFIILKNTSKVIYVTF